MSNTQQVNKDTLNNEIHLGDICAVVDYTELRIGEVTNITPFTVVLRFPSNALSNVITNGMYVYRRQVSLDNTRRMILNLTKYHEGLLRDKDDLTLHQRNLIEILNLKK